MQNATSKFLLLLISTFYNKILNYFQLGVVIGNCLSMNIYKCLLLRFNAKYGISTNTSAHLSSDYQYTINGLPIVCCNQHKDLGIVMSPDLNWESHITFISSKAYKKLGLLRRTFSSAVSVWAKRSLYLTLVRSQLVYCSQIWRPSFVKDISSLERIQRRAIYKLHPWRLYIQLQIHCNSSHS